MGRFEIECRIKGWVQRIVWARYELNVASARKYGTVRQIADVGIGSLTRTYAESG